MSEALKNTLATEIKDVRRVPHIDQYGGPWVMQESRLAALREKVMATDLLAHIAEHRASIMDGEAVNPEAPLRITGDGVAVLEINGTLTKYGSSMAQGPAMVAVKSQVRDLARDPKVQGVMIKIDSGGGTVQGTEDLAAEIRALAAKKPVLARIEDTGASGAYWLALAAPVISANATAVVGSIGVMGVLWDSSAQAAKQGVEVVLIKAGEMKGIGTPGIAISPDQRAELQRVVDQQYAIFVDTLAAGRGISREKAKALADGRVHVGANAQKLGLVDAIESGDAAYARMLGMIQANAVSGPATRRDSMTKSGAGGGGTRVLPMAAQDGGQQTRMNKEVPMDPVTAGAPSATVEPKAATLKELKDAFPKATAEFRESCQEKAMTLAQATTAYAEQLQAKLDESQATVAELKAKGTKIGAAVVAETKGTSVAEQGGDFSALVTAALAANPKLERREAIKQVARTHPEAHAAYVKNSPPAAPTTGRAARK